MDGTTEKDCSPLWTLYQAIVTDMKNSTPMWEEFISKATKLHSALKSTLVAIAAFLDAFQKIADTATNARGATKEIGTALTRMCLRHRAIENRMKTFISTLMDTLIAPLSDKADEWRRGTCGGALSRDYARECKRARSELRRRAADAQRHARKAKRAPPDAKRKADVSMQDVQERKQQLEEMEEKAVKAALIEERSRFCHFVTLLNPVVECEVAMLAEGSHLQEGSEQLERHITEPRTLPAASLQVICDTAASCADWSTWNNTPSRRPSLTSLCSTDTRVMDGMGCSTPISNASSTGTLPAPTDSPHCLSQARIASVCSADSGFRSQDALHRQLSLYAGHGSDNQSVSSESLTAAKLDDDSTDTLANTSSSTWPDLKDTAQFERAASAIMGGRPHTISAAYERGHPRPVLSPTTFMDQQTPTRPPLPMRCSSLERPSIPVKSVHHEFKNGKPTSLPPHLTKEMPQAVYVNMSELANLAAARHDSPQQEKVCSESSASESSLESSSGYGSQGAFAAEDHALNQQMAHADVVSEIITLRRDKAETSIAAVREHFSISLGSLEEAVRSLDEINDEPSFATISKTKPCVPKKRPVSMTASSWSRRGSSASIKPPPPVRRSSSISRPQRPQYGQTTSPPCSSRTEDSLPPPPAYLLQPEAGHPGHQGINVAETVKQLTEIRHTPASPGLIRRNSQLQIHQNLISHQSNQPHQSNQAHQSRSQVHQSQLNQSQSQSQQSLTSFQIAKNSIAANLNPIYGQTGQRMMTFDQQTTTYRKGSLNSSASELNLGQRDDNSMSSFGPRLNTESSHYGQAGYKIQERKFGPSNTHYASPNQIISGFNNLGLGRSEVHRPSGSPLAIRKEMRSQSADRRHDQSGLIASLSAKLAPQLSPRTTRRPISTITQADPVIGKVGAAQPAFLDKLSATLQQRRPQPDPRACHTSLMEQIKRGATLRRNKHCNDRSAPKIR